MAPEKRSRCGNGPKESRGLRHLTKSRLRISLLGSPTAPAAWSLWDPEIYKAAKAGKVILDTKDALTLREAAYPAVFYVPRKDVDMASLERTEHSTHCPYKGDCAYCSIPAGGERAVNAVWTYEAPFDAVVSIKDHLAVYTDRVDSIVEHAAV